MKHMEPPQSTVHIWKAASQRPEGGLRKQARPSWLKWNEFPTQMPKGLRKSGQKDRDFVILSWSGSHEFGPMKNKIQHFLIRLLLKDPGGVRSPPPVH